MMEKEAMREKDALMEKQGMMEKEEMMAKQRMMERNQKTHRDVDMKNQMSRKQKMQQKEGLDETRTGERVQEKGEMTRKQQAMLTKKQNRKRLREKKVQVEDDYDEDDEDEDNINSPRGWGQAVDCMLTPWSDWSECSVSCGVGVVMKTRMVKIEPQNGGNKCQGKLIKKKKCRQKKCATDCVMTEWGEWSSCSETCGNNAVQIRKRQRLQRPLHGGLACPSKMEKKFCNVPMCTNSNVRKEIFTY
uniref:Spondin-like TSP1 domain-containing protein n=1 Tax=Arion vulgaris TaxID=1028688 RepID=A0A0B6YS03_9EUPU